MKNILLPAFIIILFLSACKKYEDGPGISFRSREERVANVWVYEKVTAKYADTTFAIKNNTATNLRYTFIKGGNAEISLVDDDSVKPIYGTWTLANKDKSLLLDFSAQGIQYRYEIIKLKENSLWLKGDNLVGIEEASKYECHLRPE